MPAVNSFSALGVGNGFPFCPDKVDVTNISIKKWTTAGGYNSNSTGAVTDLQLSESKRLAMLWFWNSYRLNGHARVVGHVAVEAIDTEGNMVSVGPLGPGMGSLPAMPPKKRVCLSNTNAQQNTDNEISFFARGYSQVDHLLYATGLLGLGVIAMYKGSVDDPTKFIGYGIDDAFFYAQNEQMFYEGAFVGVSSLHYDDDYYSGEEEFTSTFGTFPIGNDNIHVVKSAGAWSISGEHLADAAALTATNSLSSQDVNASMTSIDTYTYN